MERSENESGKEYSPLLENMEVKNEEQLLEEEIAKKIRDGFIIKVFRDCIISSSAFLFSSIIWIYD